MASVFPGDLESGHPIEKDFSYNNNVAQANVSVRLNFLRKVYGILLTQLLVTMAVSAIMFAMKNQLLQMASGPILLMLSFLASIGLLIALVFKKYETPTNYILLMGFTFTESIIVGSAVISYSAAIVFQAVGLTAVVTFCLMLYAMQTKRDFSKWGTGLLITLLILVLAGAINILIGSSMFEFCLSLGGAVIFSMTIIYDTQRIMQHCSPEDYVVACVDLYLDIINLFLYILRILKEMQRE
ncbi:unnamed protein product [Calicophoron daubneyi]|uniref:Uncharacterized protein n=1 Tax=Calicophoron daubneyi TaxID=300641 RepID=A0AAV2TUY3_CALDB